jgi:hypothetical protein
MILSDSDLSKYVKLGGNIENYQQLSCKYYDTLTLCPELAVFSNNIHEIIQELNKSYDKWASWTDITQSKDNSDWTVIPIYGFGKFTKNSNDFPFLKNIILNNDYIDLVSFSRLGKKTILIPHQGWAMTANVSIRSQLGLIVPEKCGLWVEGEQKIMENCMWLSFDDSKHHTAFNQSESDRIVLIIDIKKPDFIQKGNSQVKNTESMNKYIIES